jgi:prolycopene isomerase
VLSLDRGKAGVLPIVGHDPLRISGMVQTGVLMGRTDMAVVIGSGIGGSAAAALLAKRGFEVLLLERNRFPGGKAGSYRREGFTCDMGVHYAGRGERGPLGEVARQVSADLRFIKRDPFLRMMKGNRYRDLSLRLTSIPSLMKLGSLAGLKAKNALGAYRFFRTLMRVRDEQGVLPYDEMTVKDFLLSCTEDEELHRLIDVFCGLLYAVPYSEASAGEFLWGFGTWARDASCSYPKGGFDRVAASYLEACERLGGRIHHGEAVTAIRVENERVVGVETDKDFHPAGVVVSNAGIRKTIELAGRESFDPAYLRWADRLKNSAGVVTIKYAVDRSLVDLPITIHYDPGSDFTKSLADMEKGVVSGDPPLYIPCPTIADPELAPPGKHLLLVGTIVPASAEAGAVAEKVLDRVEAKMKDIIPGLYDHILWKHRTNLDYVAAMGGRGGGEAIGLAQRFDQVGRSKPAARMPLDGLYLVGCDAGGRGIGTEQAADSALKVAESVSSHRRES